MNSILAKTKTHKLPFLQFQRVWTLNCSKFGTLEMAQTYPKLQFITFCPEYFKFRWVQIVEFVQVWILGRKSHLGFKFQVARSSTFSNFNLSKLCLCQHLKLVHVIYSYIFKFSLDASWVKKKLTGNSTSNFRQFPLGQNDFIGKQKKEIPRLLRIFENRNSLCPLLQLSSTAIASLTGFTVILF